MDGTSGLGKLVKKAGTDAYVQLEYGSIPPKHIRTRYVTDTGAENLTGGILYDPIE